MENNCFGCIWSLFSINFTNEKGTGLYCLKSEKPIEKIKTEESCKYFSIGRSKDE